MREPFEYDKIFYNDVIWYLEEKWGRKLNDHEKHVLIEGYKYGRLVEAENEIKILEPIREAEAIKYIADCLKPSKELEDSINSLFDILEESENDKSKQV